MRSECDAFRMRETHPIRGEALSKLLILLRLGVRAECGKALCKPLRQLRETCGKVSAPISKDIGGALSKALPQRRIRGTTTKSVNWPTKSSRWPRYKFQRQTDLGLNA
jgi:hypothetical protein